MAMLESPTPKKMYERNSPLPKKQRICALNASLMSHVKLEGFLQNRNPEIVAHAGIQQKF